MSKVASIVLSKAALLKLPIRFRAYAKANSDKTYRVDLALGIDLETTKNEVAGLRESFSMVTAQVEEIELFIETVAGWITPSFVTLPIKVETVEDADLGEIPFITAVDAWLSRNISQEGYAVRTIHPNFM